jgi:hypothetical protein
VPSYRFSGKAGAVLEQFHIDEPTDESQSSSMGYVP